MDKSRYGLLIFSIMVLGSLLNGGAYAIPPSASEEAGVALLNPAPPPAYGSVTRVSVPLTREDRRMIESDACETGWCTGCAGCLAGGIWSSCCASQSYPLATVAGITALSGCNGLVIGTGIGALLSYLSVKYSSPDVTLNLPRENVPVLQHASEQECSICLENFSGGANQVITLPCGHAFHSGCILGWFNSALQKGSPRRACPFCRRQFTVPMRVNVHETINL